MVTLSETQITTQLNAFQHPLWVSYQIKSVETTDQKVLISILLAYPLRVDRLTVLQSALVEHLQQLDSDCEWVLKLTSRVSRHRVQNKLKPQLGIRNIIAVGSGKGGVGKSTLSVNLAIALSQTGAKVGLLDADIYGPSQTQMLGAHDKPTLQDKKFIPLEKHGIYMMSMGALVDQNAAMIWRGPMVSGALLQLLNDVHWPELDYLIVDLPPGTGDIQLTMAQKLPISGAVVVTTPQDIALLDARRAIGMFNKVSIPVLGVIENMSHHICRQCGHTETIFGQGGAEKITQEFSVPSLGQLPLLASIGADVEKGIPTVAKENDSAVAMSFQNMAEKVVLNLAQRPKDYSIAMPTTTLQSQN